MAPRSDGPGDTRALVVIEDGVKVLLSILHWAPQLSRPGHPRITAFPLEHQSALKQTPEFWAAVDLVLLDAYDIATQQHDPRQSRFAALAVLAELEHLQAPPPVIAYSTDMKRPEVRLPLREHSIVRGFYDSLAVFDHLESIVWDEVPVGQVSLPTTDDLRLLGVGPNARLSEAHQLMKSRQDAWAQVWKPSRRAPDPKTRAWINTHIAPLLDLEGPTRYKAAVSVVRKIAGLPASFATQSPRDSAPRPR